jgi:hypothetical protein
MRTHTIVALAVGMTALSGAIAVGGPNGRPPAAAPSAAIPAGPTPHIYAASHPNGNTIYWDVAHCGTGCFTMTDPNLRKAPDTEPRYRFTWSPEAGQWQTEVMFYPDGIVCADSHTEASRNRWITDDLVHFFSDTEMADFCGSFDVKPDSSTFTLTPAF